MGTTTSRKGLYIPEVGETGYDDEFATSMETIDKDGCFSDLAEIILAIWTFKRGIVVDPDSPEAPLSLGANAHGQLVAGLNAEFLGGRESAKVEQKTLWFAGNQSSGDIRYWMGKESSITESHSQHLFPDAELLGIYLNASFNSLNGDSEFIVRRNGAATGLLITLPSGSTGFSSAVSTIAISNQDLLSLRIETDAATSGSISFSVRVDYRVV